MPPRTLEVPVEKVGGHFGDHVEGLARLGIRGGVSLSGQGQEVLRFGCLVVQLDTARRPLRVVIGTLDNEHRNGWL